MNDALEWVTDTLVANSFTSVVPSAFPPDFPTDAPSALSAVLASAVRPATLLFLIRRYPADGRPGLRDALERGLTDGLAAFNQERDPRTRCQWLGALAEATALVDDAELSEMVVRLLPGVIDELEQFVRGVYEPGEGALGASCHEQLRLASALIVAFDLSGRLPYSMLAEELLQTARHRWWDAGTGAFRADFSANCMATQVCCRLAAIHRDDDYAARAVVAPAARYDQDAALVLASLELHYREHKASAADYGLALLDWLAFRVPN